MSFFTLFKHLMTLKITDQIFFAKSVFNTILYNEKKLITRGLFVDPDQVCSRIRVRMPQKDRIRIRNTACHYKPFIKFWEEMDV